MRTILQSDHGGSRVLVSRGEERDGQSSHNAAQGKRLYTTRVPLKDWVRGVGRGSDHPLKVTVSSSAA